MYCMMPRIPPAGSSPADALDPAEAELRHRAPGVTANVSGPQEEYAQSPRASHAGTATWAVLNLNVACGFTGKLAPFALKPLLHHVIANTQSSAASAAAQVPLRTVGDAVDDSLLWMERTGAIGANGAAAPRNEQDAAVTDQELLNVAAPQGVHAGDDDGGCGTGGCPDNSRTEVRTRRAAGAVGSGPLGFRGGAGDAGSSDCAGSGPRGCRGAL